MGLAPYTAAAIAKSPPIPTGIQGFMYDIRTAILPFIFIFNTDLILHGIHSWGQGGLVFVATCFGCFAFASATQGWFAARNRWYDVMLLLGNGTDNASAGCGRRLDGSWARFALLPVPSRGCGICRSGFYGSGGERAADGERLTADG